MTTPTGSPSWTRTAVHTQYGGDVNKRNLLSVGAIDAQTDVTAEQIARISADLAAITLAAPFAVITYLNNDTSPDAPTIQSVYGQIGIVTTPYNGAAPPTGFPSAARNGTGDVTFTFASSYTDAYGVSGNSSLIGAAANVIGSSARIVNYYQPGAHTVRVIVFTTGGAASSDDTVSLIVW